MECNRTNLYDNARTYRRSEIMISEIDLKDFNRSEEPVKLYDVPRNSVVTPLSNLDLLVNFDHLDGMYSFCKLFGTEDIVHLGACTEVYVWKKK